MMYTLFDQFRSSDTQRKRVSLAAMLGSAVIMGGALLSATGPVEGKTSHEDSTDPQARTERPILPGVPATSFSVLGSVEFKVGKHRFQKDWKGLLSRVAREKPLYAQCDQDRAGACAPRVRKWRQITAQLRGRPKMEVLERLNTAINKLVPYVDDSKVFGKRDYWATPIEFLTRAGDCEDYAILKFLTLRELGFDARDMRVVIVKETRRRLMHAVLAVDLGGTTYILDNLYNHPVKHQHVLKYVPIYSVSYGSQWIHVTTAKIRTAFVTQIMNGTARLSDSAGGTRAEKPQKREKISTSREGEAARVVDWT